MDSAADPDFEIAEGYRFEQPAQRGYSQPQSEWTEREWDALSDDEFWDHIAQRRYREGSTLATGEQLKAGHRLIGTRMYSSDDILKMIEDGREYWEPWLCTAKRYRQDDPERPFQSLPLPVELYGKITPQLTGRALVKGLLMAGTKIVVFGAPGSGKSFLLIDQCLHIAAGLPWFGRKVHAGRVVYIGAEGQGGLRLRVEAWRKTRPDVKDIPFALIPSAVDLLDPAADLDKLRQVLRQLSLRWGGIDLLSIDTLAASFGSGDENGPDMAAYVANIERLCAPYGCAAAIVTHSPLEKDAKRPRGHSSLWGAADTVIHVAGDRDAPVRRLHVIKQKDGDPGNDILFDLKSVEIGIDEDGDPVTSCIVVEADGDIDQTSSGRRLSPKEKIAKMALDRVMIAKGFTPPHQIPSDVLNRHRIGKVATLSEWRSEALSALSSPDVKPDTVRRSFDRARDSLQAAEIIGIWQDWVWFTF